MKLYIICRDTIRHKIVKDGEVHYKRDNIFWSNKLNDNLKYLAKHIYIYAPNKIYIYDALWEPKKSTLLGELGILTPSYVKAISMYCEDLADCMADLDGSAYCDSVELNSLVCSFANTLDTIPHEKYGNYIICTI